MIWPDFFRETIRGRTLYRILFQQAVLISAPFIRGRVLDIGSGSNPTYQKYLPQKIEYLKTDYVQKENIQQVLDFNNKFPFEDESVQTVFLFHNLYIAEDPRAVLEEVKRVLSKDGFILISNPFGTNIMPEPHDYNRLTEEGLDNLITKTSLVIVEAKALGDRFSVIANTMHAFFVFWPVRLVFNVLAIFCDKLIPKGMKRNHPFPLGYFYVIRK